MKNAYTILIVKCGRKRPHERPRHRWEDNIKMCYRETGCENVEWSQMAQGRVQWRTFVNMKTKLLVPSM
jgi:hypothetical protein